MGARTTRCLRLQPENLKHVWNMVRYGVARSCPPNVPLSQKRIRKVLGSLLAGRAQCWVLFEEGEDQRKHLHATLVTAVETEALTGAKFLNIWAAYGFRSSPVEWWAVVRQALTDFARAQGCSTITAITTNPHVAKIAQGEDASLATFLVKEI